jgi:hypothetical protein
MNNGWTMDYGGGILGGMKIESNKYTERADEESNWAG